MVETELIKELDAAVMQLNLWWRNKVPANSYPKKLEGKIRFLKGYLGALKKFRDETELERITKEIRGEVYHAGRFISKV